jgi:hypothetical protein
MRQRHKARKITERIVDGICDRRKYLKTGDVTLAIRLFRVEINPLKPSGYYMYHMI